MLYSKQTRMNLKALQTHTGVQQLTAALRKTAAELFVVGGSVRDAMLDNTVKDLDVVIRGMALEPLEAALRKIGRVDIVGRRFAVLKVNCADGSVIDVALPRTDASFGTGRYRDVEVRADPTLPIERDLERRDFTINAMAWNVKDGKLIDPFNGQQDLSQQLVRAVGSAADRFQEDATRILRAIRFAVQLNFTIEPATAAAIPDKLSLLNNPNVTPVEVIAKELVRAFTADPVRAFDLYHQHGITHALLPELEAMQGCAQPVEYHAEGDVWTHTRLALAALQSDEFHATFKTQPSPMLVITTLLHDIGKPPTQKTPERDGTDRIRFDRHAPVGAKIARDINTRLRLDSAGIDSAQLVWSIEHHLDILNLDAMRATTLERTYLQPPERGQLLQQLTWADGRAALDPEDKQHQRAFHQSKRFKQLQERLKEIQSRGYARGASSPLLSGQDIMDALNLPAGPLIGKYIEQLRNAQLNGQVTTRAKALAWLKKLHGHKHQG